MFGGLGTLTKMIVMKTKININLSGSNLTNVSVHVNATETDNAINAYSGSNPVGSTSNALGNNMQEIRNIYEMTHCHRVLCETCGGVSSQYATITE